MSFICAPKPQAGICSGIYVAARRQSGYLHKHTVTRTAACTGRSGGARERGSEGGEGGEQADERQKEQLRKFLPESERLEQEGRIFWDAKMEK